jgi:glycolate oxidase iron-sulfur subunit
MTARPLLPSVQRSATPLGLEAAGLDLCVHCGFCLQACPTYLALEDENDSPRGRLVLMRALLEGELAPDDPSLGTHIDQCLGCRGCESACPSGVPYGQLLEATRATMAIHRPLPWLARLILAVFRRPALLAVALGAGRLVRWTRLSALFRVIPGGAGFALAMLESTRPRFNPRPYAGRPGDGGTVTLLEGCVMRALFRHTNGATHRVLAYNSYQVVPTAGQGCCGALHAHAGDAEGARALARKNIAAFEASGAEWIAVNASGCGAAMKEYGHLLAGDAEWSGRARALSARVRDVSELLAVHGPARGGEMRASATCDAPCHLQHAQRVVDAPLRVLGAIPGLDLRPLRDSDQCCGSAGIYNLIEPEVSDLVLRPKLEHISATGAELVLTGNPGCLMQIGAGLLRRGASARAVHPIDLLDASYAAATSGPR